VRRLVFRHLIGRDGSGRPAPDTQAGEAKTGDRNYRVRDGPERVVARAGTAHHARSPQRKEESNSVMTTPTTIQASLFMAGLLTTADNPGWASRVNYCGRDAPRHRLPTTY
jgi:hypothetical protein